jgi:hypothetical protein
VVLSFLWIYPYNFLKFLNFLKKIEIKMNIINFKSLSFYE